MRKHCGCRQFIAASETKQSTLNRAGFKGHQWVDDSMAQQTVSSNGVTATLWAVVEEIDDDDEDILEVTIDVVNES